jgi:hypothetical protein
MIQEVDMLITREIPRAAWRRVLDDISRLHAGATAHLEVLDAEQGVQTYGAAFTLVGLTSDGDAAHGSIVAMLGGRSHITHLIADPVAMHVELSWETRTANFQITAGDGTRTLIHLGPPVLPAPRPSERPAAAAAHHGVA